MSEVKLKVTNELECDVLVIGGGPAGIASAICAARHGANTIMIERNGCLGGMATSGLVGPFMTSYDTEGKVQLIRGFFDEIVRRMEAQEGAVHPSDATYGTSYTAYREDGHRNLSMFDPEVFKYVAEQMCEESGVKLIYHLNFVGCEKKDNTISAAYFVSKLQVFKIHASIFIDCTGDADVAVNSGVATVYGDGNGDVQPTSLFFTVRGVDKEEMEKHMQSYPDKERKFYMKEIVEERNKGNYPILRNRIMLFEGMNGEWILNMSQIDDIDGNDCLQVTEGAITGRKQIRIIIDFLKKYAAGCKNITLSKSAEVLGVRETNSILGEYRVTNEDVANSVRFEDAIFCCSNSQDIHTKGYVNYVVRRKTEPYYIPYRALLPKEIDNLLVAGRCISGEREVVAAIRVMPTCFAMGQAAGTAAALCVAEDKNPKEVDIKKLICTLVEDGVYLP